MISVGGIDLPRLLRAKISNLFESPAMGSRPTRAIMRRVALGRSSSMPSSSTTFCAIMAKRRFHFAAELGHLVIADGCVGAVQNENQRPAPCPGRTQSPVPLSDASSGSRMIPSSSWIVLPVASQGSPRHRPRSRLRLLLLLAPKRLDLSLGDLDLFVVNAP